MELPENCLEHWKAKFIDGLPLLFAERVKKTLQISQGAIPYSTYTYGRLIGACTQEGINFLVYQIQEKQTKHKDSRDSNSGKPHRKKRSREERRAHCKSNRFTKNRSRQELAKIKCYKYGKFGHIAPNCRPEKLKTLELEEDMHDKICILLYTSGSESGYDDYSESGSKTNKPKTSGNTQSATIDACKCRGDICSCENNEFYKLQSQFEDMNINTITSDNVIELLKEVPYNTLLNNILSKQHVVIRDTSFDDLKGEIEQLKQEIKSLKQNQIICDHRLTQIESANNKGKNIVDENTLAKSINIDPKQNIFLGMMQINHLYPPIILGTPFINALYPFTSMKPRY
ncbi:hypothetical protein H5410_004229 [Solanum commersonii]|uniref:Zinc knuckle family protein n=1 Tax=Solanum commersonii TaxID=4109 RepID=A0A9J6B749_SOLCO|nr:hypothetical protein H5410_004229 [Solanum commersonii]